MRHIVERTGLAIALLAVAAVAPGRGQDVSSDYVEPYQRKALEIYRHAISYRTVAGYGQVPALAEYLAGEFRAGGFPDEDVHVLRHEETAALVVRYPGDGSSGEKPILLLAHMDVVDALPEDWELEPFALTERDGHFIGRGTSDDKFGVAMLTATFLRLKAEGFVPNRDLVIAFTGDEETSMVTTQALVSEHRALTDAEFALNADAGEIVLDENGEATSYQLQAAEKTYATFALVATNPGGHSSRPRADNAIYDLATALRKLQAYRFPVRATELTRAFFRATGDATHGELGEAMRRFADDPSDAWAADVLWTHPEYVGITRTTCVATMLRAGHAENALPQSATATVNCRIFPGVGVDDVRDTLQTVIANPAIRIDVLGEPSPSPESPLRDDVVAAVTKAVHARFPDIPIIPLMAPYGTDGKHVRAAGIPTYGVMGAFGGVGNHGLNERVPVRAFFGALEHWYVLLNELAG